MLLGVMPGFHGNTLAEVVGDFRGSGCGRARDGGQGVGKSLFHRLFGDFGQCRTGGRHAP